MLNTLLSLAPVASLAVASVTVFLLLRRDGRESDKSRNERQGMTCIANHEELRREMNNDVSRALGPLHKSINRIESRIDSILQQRD
jgi:hypothetical protein